MIIPCFRCGKEINSPDASNADYIMAKDTIVKEPREVLVALKHNQATLDKKAQGLAVDDSEYDAIEIPNIEASKALGEDLVTVIVETKDKDIQKTGVICPDCYRKEDIIIWGVHKSKGVKLESK